MFLVSEHVVRYSAPQAGAADPALSDGGYDGLVEGGVMAGGLGQLTDGIYATHPSNPFHNPGNY